MNNWHQHRISKLIVQRLFGTISEKKIAILGFAFKANTNDTRESAAIQICKDLLEEGAELIIHDPIVNKDQIQLDLENDVCISKSNEKNQKKSQYGGSWNFTNDLNSAFEDAHAIIILTEWEEYANINWSTAYKKMQKPAWVFDSRLIVDTKKVLDANLRLWRIGDGT